MTQTALDCGLLVNWTKVTLLSKKLLSFSTKTHYRVLTVLEWWVRMWWLCWSMLSPEWEWQMWRWWPYWMTPLALLWLAPTSIPTPPLVTLELSVHLVILIIWRSHSWHWNQCFLHRGRQAGVQVGRSWGRWSWGQGHHWPGDGGLRRQRLHRLHQDGVGHTAGQGVTVARYWDNIKLRNFGPSWPISFHLGSSCLDHLESLESMYWALLKALKLKTNKKK